MRFDDWDRYEWYPPSRPLEAKGGIKAASQRGSFGQSWWGRRWVEVLESFNIGARLQRGRSYARKGQVLSIEVKKGLVEAVVQGSRETPYQVTIRVRPLIEPEWKRVAHELSRGAIFAAKLLAGEMPQDIERAFTAAGLSLFPGKLKDISTQCSCPDWSNPCKHVAAVYYLLGEAFDQDPFLIFRLRGMDRCDFTAILCESGGAEMEQELRLAPEPLAVTPKDFWAGKPLPPDLLADTETPKTPAALPRRLGNLQFWRGEVPLPKALEESYASASRRGESLLFGDSLYSR